MRRRAPDPDVLPASVTRHSLTVDLYDTAADLAEIFPDLSLPERLRGAVRKRHIEYLAGRWCARACMLARRGHAPELPIDEHRAPIWPEGLVGAITHTQGFVSAAVATRDEVRALGLDTEERFPLDRARRLDGHLAHPGEVHALTDDALDEATAATLVFSAKESVFKCLHPFVRRYFGFHAARVLGAREGRFTVTLTETLTDEFRAGVLLEGRYVITDSHVHTGLALPR